MKSLAFRVVLFATLCLPLAGCVDDSPVAPAFPLRPSFTQLPKAPVVNSLATDGDGVCDDVECTLKEALNPLWLADSATVTFAPGLTGTIYAPSNGYRLFRGVKLLGPGADKITVDGRFATGTHTFRIGTGSRYFQTFELSGLTIDGAGSGRIAVSMFTSSGNVETALLRDVVIKGYRPWGSDFYPRPYAAVFVYGMNMNIENAIITDNHATDTLGIGGVSHSPVGSSSLSIVNSTISGNSGSAGGVMIYEWGGGYATTITGSTIANNTGRMVGGISGAALVSSTMLTANIGGNCGTWHPAQEYIVGGYHSDPPQDGGNNTDDDGTCNFATFAYDFTGFYAPIQNAPAVNAVKAGSAVPIKFGLGGDHGLDVFASGYPRSEGIACSTSAPLADVSGTVSAGGSVLSFDAVTQTYTYVWKTDKAWAGTCRVLTVKLNDGGTRSATFSFAR